MNALNTLRACWARSLAVGLVNALLLSAVMVPVIRAGISPLPTAPSLAFAEALAGRSLPLPVGLLLHVAYVTAWSMAFVAVAHPRLTFARALGLGLALWLVALAVIFPINGWGFLGLAIGPKLIVAALAPHLLFTLVLWALCRIAFARDNRHGASVATGGRASR